ncbi:hypothetical protein CYMTET_23754 [Cymbomonas tetramitiformis]|uniref:Sialidase domain-containing protein n=1 Tax=Cymbomonas tetramitiformis TaxID=36881 RepID=A0AAE0FY08_9CHLO|nr:hypothetical protein CYMTET_23754 [Cymbomonas tetramitiformis]
MVEETRVQSVTGEIIANVDKQPDDETANLELSEMEEFRPLRSVKEKVFIPRFDQAWAVSRDRKGRVVSIGAVSDRERNRTSTYVYKEKTGPRYMSTGVPRKMTISPSPEVIGCPTPPPLNVSSWDSQCNGFESGKLMPRAGTKHNPIGPFVSFIPPVKHENKAKRSAHGATLVSLPGGDLMCAWFSGEEGMGGVLIAAAKLRRSEWRWDPPAVVSYNKRSSMQNPVLFFDNFTDSLNLLHTVQGRYRGQSHSYIVITHSHDGGESWSDIRPVIKRAGAFLKHSPILAANGKQWLLAMYFTPGSSPKQRPEGAPQFTNVGNPRSHISAMRRSPDGGHTWLANHQVQMTFRGEFLVQPCILRLPASMFPERFQYLKEDAAQLAQLPGAAIGKPSILLAMFRSRKMDWIYQSYSLNDGRKWTKAQKSPLPNNNGAFQVIALRSRVLVVAFNNVQRVSRRYPLSVALSEDGGDTWPYVRDLESEPYGGTARPLRRSSEHPNEFSYPSMVQGPDGVIHIVYTWKRELIKHVAVSEAWIRSAGAPTKGAFHGSGERKNLSFFDSRPAEMAWWEEVPYPSEEALQKMQNQSQSRLARQKNAEAKNEAHKVKMSKPIVQDPDSSADNGEDPDTSRNSAPLTSADEDGTNNLSDEEGTQIGMADSLQERDVNHAEEVDDARLTTSAEVSEIATEGNSEENQETVLSHEGLEDPGDRSPQQQVGGHISDNDIARHNAHDQDEGALSERR